MIVVSQNFQMEYYKPVDIVQSVAALAAGQHLIYSSYIGAYHDAQSRYLHWENLT